MCRGTSHELALSAWPQVGQPSSQARPQVQCALLPSPLPHPPPTPPGSRASPPPKPLPHPSPRSNAPSSQAGSLEGVRPPAEAGAASGADEGGRAHPRRLAGASLSPSLRLPCGRTPAPHPALPPGTGSLLPKRLLSFRTVRTSQHLLPCPPFLGKASVGPMCRGCGAGLGALQKKRLPLVWLQAGSVVWCPGRGPMLGPPAP